MTSKKRDFTTPTEAFISSIPQVEKPAPNAEGYTVPAGYKLVRESKSSRLQLLVTPTTASNLKTAAAVQGISLNELCNRIFDEYLKERG